jgi:2'-5' RNA ligase
MKQFALFFIPPKSIYSQLELVAIRLWETYQGFPFELHLTLLSGITGEVSEVKNKTEQLAKQLKPFAIDVETRASFSTTYFQSVFVRAKASAALMEANLTAKHIFKHPNTLFMPHISLLYGDYQMPIKEAAAESVVLPPLSFVTESLVLVPSTPNPKDWVHVAEYPLAKQEKFN